ncbi:tonB-system energizer ExbB [Azospirillum soli]|uniref:tonB-system energizer ExbB n=1 Tax=Azospirillum soli TaxID=1304799 RepID=UPI001FE943E4|nr:tonB-system energizer ExbB [Azospirillum soli]MBP2311463.1 biopolymer transport protein ExbB [Azospirillum soli]
MPNASPFRPAALLATASLAIGALMAAPVWAQEAAPATAPAAAPMADPVATATLPHDLSPWGMFMAASPVVQAVMIGLVLASVATWTVFLAKSMELASAKRKARAALAALDQARSLTQAADTVGFDTGPAGSMLRATFAEVHQSADAPSLDGLKERTESRLQRIEAAEGRRMMRGTGILASIGSTAPFVGLFGTVWGIMTSFIGIAKTQTTNLAVVAPGIAEALLATAIGLIAAIPAVVIYNAFSRSIGGYRAQLGDASAAVQRLLSRDIDRHALPRASAAAE